MIYCFLLLLMIHGSLSSQDIKDYYFFNDISSLPLSSWDDPATEDYLMIDQFLQDKKNELVATPHHLRPFKNDYLNKEFYGWITYRSPGNLFAPEDIRGVHIDYLGNDPNIMDKCVICYVTYNKKGGRNYMRGLKYLTKALKKINFEGHLIYCIGAYPGLSRGRLLYADVPYAFKTFLFEEAKNLGYHQVLWLDACCVPLRSISPLFKHIEKEGIGFRGMGPLSWTPLHEGYKELMPEFNISEKKSYLLQTNQVIGINFDSEIGNQFLDRMIQLIDKKIPFLMGDDPPLTFLVHDMNLQSKQFPKKWIAELAWNSIDYARWKKKHPKAMVCHNYALIQEEIDIPENLFD